jgi:RNA polymerase sigma-70 factor (ECF subfamily)
LRRLGVPERDLEDAAQETFIAIAGKLDTFDPDRPLRAWILGFVFRVAANARRKKTAVPSGAGLGDLLSPDRTPEETAIGRQAQTLALRIFDRMDSERRDVLVMHDLEALGAPDIARLLDIPVNTVYSRLRAAREEFEGLAARMSRGRVE